MKKFNINQLNDEYYANDSYETTAKKTKNKKFKEPKYKHKVFVPQIKAEFHVDMDKDAALERFKKRYPDMKITVK